jgi:NAD(P)-dependent dehydrogenase (short-subunit alcohol dehydrogenase family)
LAHVLGFVRERAGLPEPVAAPEPVPEPASDEAVGFPRRVPVAVVRPPIDWCEPTGVELTAGSRVVVVPDEGGVAAALVELLTERGVEVVTVDRSTAPDDAPALVGAWRAAGDVTGLFALAGLDPEPTVEQLDPADWHEGLRVRVKLVAALARELHPELEAGRFLVSATRLGGRFGYDDDGAAGAMGGAVSGLTKALGRERPAALVKVVDTELDADAGTVARALLAEVERDPGAVEVGHARGLRWTIGLRQLDAGPDPAQVLGPGATLVVTGAAGSIVSAITADLAAASRGTFHLLDLTPEPARDDPDLARFVADRDALKTELAGRITARGERATPALVERELARIERSRAALDAIQAVERAGGRAVWYQVDLTDADAVAAVMASVLDKSGGSVDVLVHAAGLEISHALPDKPQREYDLVFDVKANGWYHLLRGLGEAPLGAAVVFSSIAGRFGNGGQTDYSAANDLLCKSVSSFRRWRPQTRGIAIDWTAWAGIGMASRGSIPKMMALAGIEMLPAVEGIPIVRRELEAVGDGGEVVVAGSLGVLAEERHPTGGLAGRSVADRGPMTGEARRATAAEGLVVATVLDPLAQPFLDHHRIDGTPVLPGVMGIEAFCEVASLLAPDLQVVAVEDVAFLAPCKCYRDEPRPIEVAARLVPDGQDLVAECELRSTRLLAGDAEQTTVHFTGRVRLAATGVAAPTAAVPGPAPDVAVGADDVYRVYFHGPAYQVVDQAWRAGDVVVGRLVDPLPANHEPPALTLRTEPRLLELCFQTAGLRELGAEGRMALPERVERVELFEGWSGAAPVHAIAEPGDDGASAVVVDSEGKVRLRLTGYRTIAVPGGVDQVALDPLRQAMG